MTPRTRGNLRFSYRNLRRTLRTMTDAKLAYISAGTATDARILLARVLAAETRHAAASVQLERFREIRACEYGAGLTHAPLF